MEKVYFSTKSKPTADLTTPAKNGKHIRSVVQTDDNTEIPKPKSNSENLSNLLISKAILVAL